MKRAELVWAAAWMLVVLGFASLAYFNWNRLLIATKLAEILPSKERKTHTVTVAPTSTDNHVSTADPNGDLQKIREADKIEDRYQRCLAYPNPSEFNWDPTVVAARCHLLQRRMISWKQINDALDQHHPETLKEAFASYEKITTQPGEHGYLIWTYWWMFENAGEKTGATVQKWVDEDPESAYALSARGIQFIASAKKARGGEFIRNTPKGDIERMNAFLVKARADFEESLRRDPNLIAAYHGLLEIAQLKGDQAWASKLAHSALAIDPADNWIYDQWIDVAEPPWGGSYQKMKEIADEGAKHAADNPLLKTLTARGTCEKARALTCKGCGDDTDKRHTTDALNLYRQAAQTMPTTCFLEWAGSLAEDIGDDKYAAIYDAQASRFLDRNQYALRRSTVLQRLGETAWAQEVIDRVLKKTPDDIETLRYQGWLFETQHRWQDAAQPFLKIFDQHESDRRASMELVRIYANELHDLTKAREILMRYAKAQPENPRMWLLQAAIDREVDDRECKADLQRYLASVDEAKADEQEKEDIELARKHLTEVKQHLGEKAQ